MRGENTRQDIIDAACELFIQNGFHATTTRQIAEKIDLVPGALYNHFSSKISVFEAVLEAYHPWYKIPDALRNAKGNSMPEYIRNASSLLLEMWDEKPELMRLHLIDMLEFNGKHLPALFEKTFTKVAETIEILQSEEPGLKAANLNLSLPRRQWNCSLDISCRIKARPMRIRLSRRRPSTILRTRIYRGCSRSGTLNRETKNPLRNNRDECDLSSLNPIEKNRGVKIVHGFSFVDFRE